MSSNPEGFTVVDDADGWQQVVTKKRIQRTDTATSTKSVPEKPKKKGSAAPSRTNTNVSAKSSRGGNNFSDRKNGQSEEKETPQLEPIRVIDALTSHRSKDGETAEKDGEKKNPQKEKKVRDPTKKKTKANGKPRMFGQSTTFGANVAPASTWRPSSPSDKAEAQSSEVVEDGKVVVIPSSDADFNNEDMDDEDDAYYSDDSDYSDDDGEGDTHDGGSSRAHPESIPESVAVAAAAAASKGPVRSILRTATSGGVTPSVGFTEDNADAAAASDRAADAPQRSSTMPSGKYVPPMLRTDSQFGAKGVKLDTTNVQFKPVEAAAAVGETTDAASSEATNTPADADEVPDAADDAVVAADADEEAASPAPAASVSASQKPKRTNTGNSTGYHKKGTPGVFKNKDRTMDIDWRIHRTNTNTTNGGSPSKEAKDGEKDGKDAAKTDDKAKTDGAVSRTNTQNGKVSRTNTQNGKDGKDGKVSRTNTQNGKVSRTNTQNGKDNKDGKISRTNTTESTSKKAKSQTSPPASPVPAAAAPASAPASPVPAAKPAAAAAKPATPVEKPATPATKPAPAAAAQAPVAPAPVAPAASVADDDSDEEDNEVSATQRKKNKAAGQKGAAVVDKKKKKSTAQAPSATAGPVMSQQHWRMVVGVVLVVLFLRLLGLL